MRSYATMIMAQAGRKISFRTEGISLPNARTAPVINMLKYFLHEYGEFNCSKINVIQYDDFIYHDLGSLAFCKKSGAAPAVELMPDTFFREPRIRKYS